MELKIKNLSKTYPNGVKALKDITLNIPRGMFGLLGPNGAGKSSLMRTIAGLQAADFGEISLDGLNVLKQPAEVRKILGYLPQEFGIYPKITAESMLNHFAELKGVVDKTQRKDMVKSLLEQTNLYQHRNKKIGGFSGGMKQRFGIAQALIGNPQLIIVDEPTAGLDPMERNRFHNLLSEIGENVIVILSTHIVDDVSDLCNNMAIINKGELHLTGTPNDLISELKDKIWEKVIEKSELSEYKNSFEVISTRVYTGKLIIHVLSDNQPNETFKACKPDLEDVYFSTVRQDMATLA